MYFYLQLDYLEGAEIITEGYDENVVFIEITQQVATWCIYWISLQHNSALHQNKAKCLLDAVDIPCNYYIVYS